MGRNVPEQFHPVISRWFAERYGSPTDTQAEAWPVIASGEHVLIVAPTGSGKTLTAFLWAIQQLLTGAWQTGHTSVLYVSPLKALNNDIRRNLIDPLDDLTERFRQAGIETPGVTALTRSGDTDPAERRRMLRKPPEILITTPESLNLLLSSQGGRTLLTGLRTVILDEIHAVLDGKRGVHLITGVDRLVPLSGEFQRIALSATVKPLEATAAFVGGYRLESGGRGTAYVPRPVAIVRSERAKAYDLRVDFFDPGVTEAGKSSWEPITEECKRIIHRNRSTLLFANSRRLCEKVALKINEGEPELLAYAHHGSLSREIRTVVEQELKAGRLKAIVATNSLELGIDIGALDEVVLIQSPPSVSSAIQRIGRAGHQVGEVSRGVMLPTHGHDLLSAAVLARSIRNQYIEMTRPIKGPLDILAQVLVSMTGVETWPLDDLYDRIRTSYPYRELSRDQFDLVLNMLAGRYANTRVRELKPRVSIDRLEGTAEAREGALLALYMSGGTIPDRGNYTLRHLESGQKIGELDEEFVWETRVGEVLTLGAQNWRVREITHSDVLALPAEPGAMAPPFWHNEDFGRDFHFSLAIADFLEAANDRLTDPEFKNELTSGYALTSSAAERLVDYLAGQKEDTGRDLPHRRHVLVEYVNAAPGGGPGHQIVIHLPWGGRVNRPLGLALEGAYESRYGHRPKVYAGNDCLALMLPDDVPPEDLLSLVTSSNVEELLKARLEGSGFFAARFRECAGRALLLSKPKINQRMPLWISRLRSQKLMEMVRRYDDFPILLEAWRSCLRDEFDLDGLRQMLVEFETGEIAWSAVRLTKHSPFAQVAAWRQVNEYLYLGDEAPQGAAGTGLRSSLLKEVVFTPGLRPALNPDLVESFERKLKRLQPGYGPTSARDLVDWVKERVLMPASEWVSLIQGINEDRGDEAEEWMAAAWPKLVWLEIKDAREPMVLARENASRINRSLALEPDSSRFRPMAGERGKAEDFIPEPELADDPDELLNQVLGEWLQFQGPVEFEFIRFSLGVRAERLRLALDDLVMDERVIVGPLMVGRDEDFYCDAENFESLLRMARIQARPAVEPLEAKWLPVFLADFQGIIRPGGGVDDLRNRLAQLECLAAPAGLWESEILPARLNGYRTSWMDAVMQESDPIWLGQGQGQIAFCFEADLDLLEPPKSQETGAYGTDRLFPDSAGRYDFGVLLHRSGLSPSDLSESLWNGVWMGRVVNDGFLALRKGLESKFKAPADSAVATSRHSRRRRGVRLSVPRMRGHGPWAGTWRLLDRPEPEEGKLEQEERKKDRARLLLDRYGVVFRKLLEREQTGFEWPSIFRSLRLMELSGEILAGLFFQGAPGPQFISHPAFRKLIQKMPEKTIFWLSAIDPASVCGLGLEAFRNELPRRVEGNHLTYRGGDLVMVSQGHGKKLEINLAPDDPELPRLFGPLHHLLSREFQPMRRIRIETINDEDASRSPYVEALKIVFDLTFDYKAVVLYRGNP